MITPLMLLAQVFAILGFATYAAALTAIQAAWHLSNFEAGFLASVMFIGYVIVVPIATTLTDKIDARQVYLTGGLLGSLGLLGMGMWANGFTSAIVFLMLHGMGVAATYMPGLKILADRIDTPHASRHFSFYTACFGVGTAASYYVAGVFIAQSGWRTAFLATACGPVLAGLLVWWGTRRLVGDQTWSTVAFHLSDAFPIARWKKVLAVKEATHYMLGYSVHAIELFASRSWLVAFFTYCIAHAAPEESFPYSATLMATWISLIGTPASILGNEMALRIGRQRWIAWSMSLSAVCGLLLACAVSWHWSVILALAMLHTFFIMADSATLTAGLVISAPPDAKGVAMGLHSLLGFCGGLLGPALFGACLDAGRSQGGNGWLPAYASIVLWGVLFVIGSHHMRTK